MADLSNKISEHNAKCYMDIVKDMFSQKRGVFTFILRVDGKKIVDYVLMESVSYEQSNRTKDN